MFKTPYYLYSTSYFKKDKKEINKLLKKMFCFTMKRKKLNKHKGFKVSRENNTKICAKHLKNILENT